MRLRVFMPAVFLVVAASFTATELSAQLQGVWSGSITVNDRCGANETPVQWTSPARLHIVASQQAFIANVVIEAAPQHDQDCRQAGSFRVILPMSGQSSDAMNFAGTLILPSDEGLLDATVSGHVNGASMTLSVSGPFTASGTFTQTNNQQPSLEFSGGYGGGVTTSESCPNGSFRSEAHLDGSVVHTGEAISGIFVYSDDRHVDRDENGNCFYHEIRGTGIIMMMAHVEGNAIAGYLWPVFDDQQHDDGDGGGDGDDGGDEENEPVPFSGTISGDRISGSFTQDGVSVSFTLNRSTSGAQPIITEFTAEPTTLTEPGQPVTLRWSTLNASSVTIDNGIGQQPLSGFVIVRPATTTTYTLTATGTAANVTAQVTVTVAAGGPRVVVAKAPKGFVQRAGEGGGSDRFILANLGQTETTVTLSGSGQPFFTFSPATVTLPGRSASIVTITGTAQPAGPYLGFIAFSGAGVDGNAAVRVRMLSAVPPEGRVDPRPALARAEVRTEPGQAGSGSIAFRNDGNAVLQAIAVSDVPAIVPETGIITVAPGQTGSVSFTIDPSQRPADRPVGAVSGKFSLVFLSGSSATAASEASGAGAATSTVSVTLVHTVKPGVTSGTPSPLLPGELAMFVTGVGNTTADAGDLFLSNEAASGISDLTLYLAPATGTTQRAMLPTLQPNAVFAFPTVMSAAFGSSVPTGTAQVRSSNVADVSLAATRTNTASSEGTYGTALPVFRSDRGATSNSHVILPGVLKLGSTRTDLLVQELTGSNATFQVDFLSASGSVVGSRPAETLAPFGFAKIEDAVPAGAVAARIRNMSSASSRLAAYGLVINATGDAWPVTDPSVEATATDALIMPIVSAGEGAETLLFLTNSGSSTATVTVDIRGSRPARRRAAGHAASGSATMRPRSDEVTTDTLAPLQSATKEIGGVSSGYARITSSNTPVAASARSTREGDSDRVYGTDLPVVPASRAVAVGGSRRFTGVEDASDESRTGAVPATFRTNVLLIETSGQSARVRLTLHYTFSTSALATAEGVSSKEFDIAAGQLLKIDNVGREIIGPQRDSFGDLRSMTLDVEVIDGAGRVLPFLHAIDNGSGDSLVRQD